MKPIDFVLFDGDSTPNLSVYKVAEALSKGLVIRGCQEEYKILSYYYDKGVMVLEIEPNENL